MPSSKKRRRPESKENEALVLGVLERIATILLRLGFDAPYSERLLRNAFVLAAIRRSESSGSRATQSQIALVAGVSRLDVRRILAEGLRPDASRDIERQSRIERLIDGWKQDARFVDAKGRPKSLTIFGRKSEFAKLALSYGPRCDPPRGSFRSQVFGVAARATRPSHRASHVCSKDPVSPGRKCKGPKTHAAQGGRKV
jgi:hypothetical protein